MDTSSNVCVEPSGPARDVPSERILESSSLESPSSGTYARPHAQKPDQMTPPPTPSTSSENLTPRQSDSGPQFHEYLCVSYDFHPPCDIDTSTVTLPLNEGDIILIHSVHTNGWADGTLLNSGHRGWLPTNYCEVYDAAPMRYLLRALTNFWDVVGSGSERNPASFYDQMYTRGLIAGARYLLVCDERYSRLNGC